MAKHDLRICRGARPSDGNAWYGEDGRVFWAGKMSQHCGHWEVNLRCPQCNREGRFVENYLGKKPVLCDGERFLKPPHYRKAVTLKELVELLDKEQAVNA